MATLAAADRAKITSFFMIVPKIKLPNIFLIFRRIRMISVADSVLLRGLSGAVTSLSTLSGTNLQR